mmetsp:Transcript_26966/g.83040  ORF Transcript_26966/g.83040 Transcript_26966/m.83040 type:complete len:494 (-) Transcript_26966:3-1484(-)
MWGCESSLKMLSSVSNAFLNFMSVSSFLSMRTSFTANICPVRWSSALKTQPKEPWPRTSPLTQANNEPRTAFSALIVSERLAGWGVESPSVVLAMLSDVMPRGPNVQVTLLDSRLLALACGECSLLSSMSQPSLVRTISAKKVSIAHTSGEVAAAGPAAARDGEDSPASPVGGVICGMQPADCLLPLQAPSSAASGSCPVLRVILSPEPGSARGRRPSGGVDTGVRGGRDGVAELPGGEPQAMQAAGGEAVARGESVDSNAGLCAHSGSREHGRRSRKARERRAGTCGGRLEACRCEGVSCAWSGLRAWNGAGELTCLTRGERLARHRSVVSDMGGSGKCTGVPESLTWVPREAGALDAPPTPSWCRCLRLVWLLPREAPRVPGSEPRDSTPSRRLIALNSSILRDGSLRGPVFWSPSLALKGSLFASNEGRRDFGCGEAEVARKAFASCKMASGELVRGLPWWHTSKRPRRCGDDSEAATCISGEPRGPETA